MKTINNIEQYNEFIETIDLENNEKIDENKLNRKLYIYFDAFEKYVISRFYPRVLFALGIRAKIGGTIYQVNYGLRDEEEEFETLFNKLNIKNYTIKSSIFIKGIAIFKAIFLIIRHLPLEKLLKYKVKGVEIGIAMCDQLIRAREELDTIDRLKWNMLREVFGTIRLALTIDKQFKKNPPMYYLTQEVGYNYKVVIDFVGKYGGKVAQIEAGGIIDEWVAPDNRPYYADAPVKRRIIKGVCEADKFDFISIINNYYVNRRNGTSLQKSMDERLAYSLKKNISKEVWLEKNHIDKAKKNVCIMCHCMSDNPLTCESGLYMDYYHWLIDTLRIISKIKNVNWILKAHPSRKLYGEGDRIFNIFQQYGKSDNIYILDDSINSNLVFDLADVIVTVRGTAGLEYSSAGIPVIVAGKGFYDGFGFTIEPKSVKEYELVLKDCDKIQPLTNEQIVMAKKVSWACYCFCKTFDDTDFVLTNAIRTDFPHIGQNDIIFSKLIELYNKGITYKDSYFYKAGYHSV
ncbi:hypothetical protein [Treponema sp. C6A8]|uniref:capsular polysaccharide export protein, LipB/KpsS family n=1 Tax=Treponema sp. C6A8 TaxID=1410609 RepID=UPI000489CD1D|nr:hypothetical protein [Treponema sp. C6A8]